jgi:hypothetical protein
METTPPPGQTQPVSSGLTSTEIATLDVYSVFFLVISATLVGYLVLKLSQFLKASNHSEYQRRNTRYRVIIYSLIISSEVVRIIAQSFELANLIQKNSIYDENFWWILQNTPSLITFTIACVFAYFWHEVYRGFDDSYEDIERSNKQAKNFMIYLNSVIYVGYATVATMFMITGSSAYLIATISVVLGAIAVGSGLLIYHGYKLHRRVKRLMQLTSQTLKSSMGFTIMFRITIVCCMIKVANLTFLDYEVIINSGDLMAGILNLSPAAFNIAVIVNAVCCLLGELGLFLSLVVLLEIHDKKAKSSFAETQSTLNSSMKESLTV